ncbi:MAG: hypothetical protein J0L96_21365 [Anaerolineae bacterium]|nr:hypothetical protein [Anaerolineae bacterium]
MNKSIANVLWFSIFIILLFGCGNQESQSTSTSILSTSATVKLTQTEQKPTQIPTKTLTPIATPYPAKQVLFDYYLSGVPLPFDELVGKNYSILVLYSDRQMVIAGEIFQQKFLSEDEINQFFSQLEKMNFFKIESNQKHDSTDQLYDFGSNYRIEEMGSFYCVLMIQKPRELCAYHPYKDFLVLEMKNILDFLDNYEPNGMTPYSPDRILMGVKVGRNPNVYNLPENALLWSESFPPLASAINGTLYAEGSAASYIFSLLGGELTPKVVEQKGIEYTIEYVRPVLPHEVISFP